MVDLSHVTGFEWDEGNRDKNVAKHGVGNLESEEIFFNRPLLVHEDTPHSADEPRFYGLGQTHSGRQLFVSFTVRNYKIRVISARDMSRKERNMYEKHEKDSKI